MGGAFSSPDDNIEETVNCAVRQEGGKVVLVYRMPGGAGSPSFDWKSTGGGYQACFRATRNGRVIGHDSSTIPGHVYYNLGSANKEKSGGSYKVTMSSGGQDISRYF